MLTMDSRFRDEKERRVVKFASTQLNDGLANVISSGVSVTNMRGELLASGGRIRESLNLDAHMGS